MPQTRKFDIAELLDTEAAIQQFLNEAAQTENPAEFVHAQGIAARAMGLTEVAQNFQLN